MPLTLEQYATWLDGRPLTWPAPPTVEPPRAKPCAYKIADLRAVTWNVYGTLLAIGGGDLLFEHPNKFVMDVALEKTVQEFNMWGSMTRKPGPAGEYLRKMYGNVLGDLARLPSKDKHPEIDAERVWEAIVKKLLHKEYKWDTGFFGALNEYSVKIAYFFHASLQGTGCYPKAAYALQKVVKRGLVQGLIADGQSFTEVQLQRGLKKLDARAELWQLVDPKLCALSYKVGSKKPSEWLFRPVLDALEERGIPVGEVLHVGSRIEQDVVPAKRLGMKTALFVGDAASLQATPEQLKNPATKPDLLLTELSQIADVVPRLVTAKDD